MRRVRIKLRDTVHRVLKLIERMSNGIFSVAFSLKRLRRVSFYKNLTIFFSILYDIALSHNENKIEII